MDFLSFIAFSQGFFTKKILYSVLIQGFAMKRHLTIFVCNLGHKPSRFSNSEKCMSSANCRGPPAELIEF